MVLPGINNTNEFYSAHYLESILIGDIKKVRQRWIEEASTLAEKNPKEGVRTPDQRFKGLRKFWQKLRESESLIKQNPKEKLRLQREIFFKPFFIKIIFT